MTFTTTVQLDLANVLTDVSGETIANVQITYGRRNPYSEFQATMCTVSLVRGATLSTVDLADLAIGGDLVVNVDNGTTYRRFDGIVTDYSVDYRTINVVATSRRCLNTQWAMPAVSVDGAIGAELFAEYSLIGTGVPIFGAYVDTGTVDVKITSNAGPWISQVRQIVNSERSGTLHEKLVATGTQIAFGDANRRRYGLIDLTLTADELGLDWGLAIDDSQWVNQVTVTSPNHADYTVDNSDPLGTNFGVQIKPLTVDTALKNYDDMVSMADQLAYNRARSLWAGDTITVPMHALSTARQDDVLAATEVSSAWQLPTLTPGAPTLTFLEGYRERITNSTWTISAYLSDQRVTGQPERWQDVDPAIAWQDVDAALTWASLRGTEVYT